MRRHPARRELRRQVQSQDSRQIDPSGSLRVFVGRIVHVFVFPDAFLEEARQGAGWTYARLGARLAAFLAIKKSSSLFPARSSATNHLGCFPLPAQVSVAFAGLRNLGRTGGYGRRELFVLPGP